MPVTIDLPAFNVVPPSGLPDGPEAGYLSAVDGNTITYTSDAQDIAVGNFGDGPGAPTVYDGVLPNVYGPAGFNWSTVTDAVYVVRARATATDTATDTGDDFTPPPTTFPFLFCDYISAPNRLTFDPLTTTMSELVTITDPLTISARQGRVRLWAAGTWAGSVEVEYFALRVTYEPGAAQPPLRHYPRTDGLAASTVRRGYPHPGSVQASNRRAGGYL